MLLSLAYFFALASAATLSERNVTGTSWVYLGEDTGPPEHRASGILYGIPENETQIPDHFFTDMGFWNNRAGGAQLPAPLRGWTWGYDEFLGRYNSTVHKYRTTRRFGGNFQVLIHDLWGIDSYDSVDNTPAPGDNGNWTSYDDFLTTLFKLFIADDVIDGLYFDIWNEPDNGLYLNRGLDRYLDVWGHTYHRIQNEFPNPHTVGPSFGHLPDFGAFDWFEGWANFTAANNSVPTWISMHFLYESGDLNRSIEAFQSYLRPTGITYNGPFILNEYGAIDQQVPSTTAWCISQIERYDAIGLRSNWRGEYELHDYMANLLGKPDTYPNYVEDEATYWPVSEYQVYKYYNLNMTGHRVRTAMTEDTLGDTYATVGTDRVRILSGVRPEQGLWAIVLSCLSCVGLPTDGELPIQTFGFNGGGLYQENDGPVDLGYYVHPYTDDTLLFYIGQDDPDVAYAFEFSV